jgi:uncharacterized protein
MSTNTETLINPPALVIDTNVVLNWLFFQDSLTVSLINRLLNINSKTSKRDKTNRFQPTDTNIDVLIYDWVITPWMYQEVQRVARSKHLKHYVTLDPMALDRLEQGFIDHAHTIQIDDNTDKTPCVLRCKDKDDQIFLDLALLTQAPLLLSLDRDLLKLKKRASLLTPRLMIVQPQYYQY